MQDTLFFGLDGTTSVKPPFTIRPYTLELIIKSDNPEALIKRYKKFLMDLPNQFPFIAVTEPTIDDENNTISFLVGSLVSEMDQSKIDRKVLRYVTSYEPMIGKVSLDVQVERFRDVFMQYLCDYFRDIHIDKDYVFPISIIREQRNPNQPGRGGLGITGWDESYLVKKLLPAIVSEGLLIRSKDDKFEITEVGLNYCAQIKHPAR